MRLIKIQKTAQIETDWKAFSFIIALSCINIALFIQKNFVLNITNFAIMAAVVIIMNLSFIRTALGAVCGKAKTYALLIVLVCTSSWLSPRCRFAIASSRGNAYEFD